MDLIHDLATPLPVIVIAEMLGVPPEDRLQFKQWSDEVVATLGGPFTPPDVLERASNAIQSLADYLMPIIEDRRVHPREDLISGLVASEEQGQVLSEDEIFSTTILLLIAGNETTTNLIGNSVYALLKNPEQLALLRAEPERINGAVEELLRFCGPVQATGRVLKQDMEFGGHEMTEGQLGLVVLGAANHDPEKWGPTAEPARHHAQRVGPCRPRRRHPLLPRCAAGPGGGADIDRELGEALPGDPPGDRRAGMGRHVHHPRDQEASFVPRRIIEALEGARDAGRSRQ